MNNQHNRMFLRAVGFWVMAILLLTLTGCKKCFECTGFYGCVRCYKMADTTRTCNWSEGVSEQYLISFLQQYKDSAYACDTLYFDPQSINTCDYPQWTVSSWENTGLTCWVKK
jgi:hypothetical protein